MEYYIEASHEEDFMHNEDLYDEIIGLAELELGVAANNSAEANGNNYCDCKKDNNTFNKF